jgi:hypothetical protein
MTNDRKLPPEPSPKRNQVKAAAVYSPGQDFNACTVHQFTGYMLEGSPASQQAAMGALDNLSSSSVNISKMIIKSMVAGDALPPGCHRRP